MFYYDVNEWANWILERLRVTTSFVFEKNIKENVRNRLL